MPYSYSTSAPYSQPVTNIPVNQQANQSVNPYQDVTQVDYSQMAQPKAPSSLGVGIKTGLVGATAGALISLRHNPIIDKAGEVSTDYAIKTYEKFLENSKDDVKKAYEQGLELIKKIDNAKSPDELKNLLKSYPEAVDFIAKDLKKTPEKFIKNISRWNLNKNKKVLKNKLEASNKLRYQDVKNQIQACWDVEAKKFVKSDSVSDAMYEAIKNVKNSAKAKAAGKKALVVGGISAVGAFILHKIFSLKARANQNY